ncbi:hypothetical protein MMC26_003026 [Xylographa opegraphella]|nr:hypothetical protein [Xylographa opegraphella]
MSTYSSLPDKGKPQPVLRSKSSGWGWPRLVDIPKASTPLPIRATSVKSHSGVIHTTEREIVDNKIRQKRASSLRSHMSSIPDTEGGSQSPRPMSPVANRADAILPAPLEGVKSEDLESPRPLEIRDCGSEIFEAPSVTEAPTEPTVKTSNEHKEVFENSSVVPGRKRSTPVVNSCVVETSRSQTPVVQEVPPGVSDPISKSSPKVLPTPRSIPPEDYQAPSTPTELFSHPSPLVLPVPQSTPLPEAEAGSYFERVSPAVPIADPLPISGSSTSLFKPETSGLPEKTPRKPPAFRKLPSGEIPRAEGISVKPNASLAARDPSLPAPIDANKLPPPKILIIRATEDSTEDSAGIPVAPDLFDNVDILSKKVTKDMTAELPSPSSSGTELPLIAQSNMDVSSIPRVSTALIKDELGAVGAVEIPISTKARRVKKRRTMVRKTRTVVLRSPVLTIILGRQLALITRPALKVIAKGGELAPVAALGNGVEMIGGL